MIAAAPQAAAPERDGLITATDVVFCFSYVTWRTAERRGFCFSEDRLVQTLLDHPRVRQLLVCEPFRSAPLKLSRALLERGRPAFPGSDSAHLCGPMRLRRSDPTQIAAIERSCAAYERRIRRAAEQAGLHRPAVIVAHPLLAAFGTFDWAGRVTYYAIDDWAAYPPNRRWWPAYRAAYDRLRSGDRHVVTISDTLNERLGMPERTLTLPNGIDPAEWLEPAAPPEWFARKASPRMLYLGTIDDRLDIGQLRELAEAFPSGSLTLIGPLIDADRVAPLRSLANVEIRPPVSRAEVTGLVSAADVCVIPHEVTPLTLAMSPLKLYEYLAGGRPVAATDLPPIAAVRDPRLALAPPGHGFVDAVRRALATGPADEAERRAFIAANSWRSRHETLLGVALR
jgi:teichuronic acid biosynthesis glycosyltransferase TuaH